MGPESWERLLLLLYSIIHLLLNFASHSDNLELCWFWGFSPQRGNLSTRGNDSDLVKLEDETSAWSFWVLYAIKPTGRKRLTPLAGVINLGYQGATKLLLQTEDKENYVWNLEGFLGWL